MNKFKIHEIPFSPDDLEQLGTKEKFWFIYPSENKFEKWLFKFSKGCTGEHWSEKVAEQICELLGIPHAEYQLAKCDGRFGVITKNVVAENQAMITGNEVLNIFDPSNYPHPQQIKDSFKHIPRILFLSLQKFLQLR